jgi:hypothetical protein
MSYHTPAIVHARVGNHANSECCARLPAASMRLEVAVMDLFEMSKRTHM